MFRSHEVTDWSYELCKRGFASCQVWLPGLRALRNTHRHYSQRLPSLHTWPGGYL